MTEAEPQTHYPGSTKVNNSLEVRVVDPYKAHSMARCLVREENGALMPPEQRWRRAKAGAFWSRLQDAM